MEDRRRTLEDLEEWLRTPMLVLSLFWLGIVLLELTGRGGAALTLIATAIWIVFIGEFGLRFWLAPEKMPFLRRNWLTALALLVPAFRILRGLAVLRAARVLRGAQLVKVVGSVNRGMNSLRASLRRRAFHYVLALTMLVLLLGAAGMANLESSGQVEGGFASYGDALWWTAMLLASIGTDFWPRTLEGRLLAFLLALYGLGVFGYLTASFASYFVGRDADAPEAEVAGSRDISALRDEIRALREMLGNSTGRGPEQALTPVNNRNDAPADAMK
ncbi:two pore domain potassium channel family protein [Sphingomonas parva]|uniref:Two pore domain potassium channel family protein n=1 Tax=Sphingomonas parva TaxID=2555898 RepID=A0A4Y8ZSW3_9SPHN|nr:potassium channel family protein [Sphingomonas parva]TFI57546.1 two pore domain potassium channel family protein [Sphingomonas parva]